MIVVLLISTIIISIIAIILSIYAMCYQHDELKYVKEIAEEYLEDLNTARQTSRKLEKILFKMEQAEDDVARRTNK